MRKVLKAFDGFLDSGRKPARELASKSALCALKNFACAKFWLPPERTREMLCATFREKQSFMYCEKVEPELKERRVEIQKAEERLPL